ncbi:MAG: hypothetical protein AAB966_00900 [Patescibacteria group bacterium]
MAIEKFMRNIEDLAITFEDISLDAKKKGLAIVDPLLIRLGVAFIQQTNKNVVVDNFILHSHKHWDKMRSMNEEFFNNNSHEIFGSLPIAKDEKGTRIDAFKKLFNAKDSSGKYIVEKADRELLWEYFHALIKISMSHIHETWTRKGDFYYIDDGSMKINLLEEAEFWGLSSKFKK